MTQPNNENPSFNLWHAPWISVETREGGLERLGIRDALVNAHEYVALYDVSPLVVVGIHRLLTAILQDALALKNKAQLEALWEDGKFPKEKIEQFGKRYADRFDLFSEDKPFLQSSEIPLSVSQKELKTKETVARLFAESPSGDEVTHYHHGNQEDCVFSPATTALGLVSMPPFAISGGRGYMPSINGKPPIYVLPSGRSLFESLAASLLADSGRFVPPTPPSGDLAWWKRETPITIEKTTTAEEMKRLGAVGYLHGLLFPSRRIRLFPERLESICSRSGEWSEWSVRKMEFSNGESQRTDAPFWRDPFVSYIKSPSTQRPRKRVNPSTHSSKREQDKPQAIRPTSGKAAWREFTGLFLQFKDERTLRPSFLNQLVSLEVSKEVTMFPFRCIGLQMHSRLQAKILAWMDFGFDVPPALLQDPDGARWTERAIDFAEECGKKTSVVFYETFRRQPSKGKSRPKGLKDEKFKRLKERMEADYWAELASAFRQFILNLGDPATRQQTLEQWFETTTRIAQKHFEQAADATGDDGNALKHVVQGKQRCARDLGKLQAQFKQGGNDG